MEHAGMLQSLADYMVVRGGDYEPNYRYGIQWLMACLSEAGRKRFSPDEAAAGVLALARAQHYWAREAADVDITLAAACGQKAGEIAAGFRQSVWRRTGFSNSRVLAADAQRVRCKMWAVDPDR